MTTLEIHIGVDLAATAGRVKDAIRRHEAGEDVHEAHITFETWEIFARLLSGRRLEILRHLHRQPEASIRSLSRSLDRDYKNVHEDVKALAHAGLIDDSDGLRVEYDDIRSEFKMTPEVRDDAQIGKDILTVARTVRDFSWFPSGKLESRSITRSEMEAREIMINDYYSDQTVRFAARVTWDTDGEMIVRTTGVAPYCASYNFTSSHVEFVGKLKARLAAAPTR